MKLSRLIAAVCVALVAGTNAAAQFNMGKESLFRPQAFNQSYNDDDKNGNKKSQKDTADVLFSFKEYFGGLGHQRTARIGTLAGGSIVFVGGMQIYNKQYWKLPIIYGGIGTGIGLGCYYNSVYQKSVTAGVPDMDAKRNMIISFAAAGVAYWGSFMDGTICYKPSPHPHPGKATLYSILLPGLGQIYNGEVWKLPLYWGGLAASASFYITNRKNYIRWKSIYNESVLPEYSGPVSSETAKYYRDTYRRYRDYSMLALCAVYLIQVIDANIFAYMHDFEVDDKITLDVSPTVIPPGNCFADSPAAGQSAVGLSLDLKF